MNRLATRCALTSPPRDQENRYMNHLASRPALTRGALRAVLLLMIAAAALAGCETTDGDLDAIDGSDGSGDVADGSDGGDAADGGDATDGGDVIPSDHAITLLGPDAVMISDGQTLRPTEMDGIPLFSMAQPGFTLSNASDASVTLRSITIEPLDRVLDHEYTVLDGPGGEPLDVSDLTLGAGEALGFTVFWTPFELGSREVRVNVAYDDQTFSFVLDGRARDNGVFFDAFSTRFERILGDPSLDTLMGGMVADPQGNVYTSGNVNQWIDRFSEDISVSRVSAAGELDWSYVWHEDFEQLSPDPGQNAESGGSADSIAIDAAGDIYVVGQRSQSNSNSVFQALVLKIDGATGQLEWARAWSPTSEPIPTIASVGSRGYAVDVDGGHVYLTGLRYSSGTLVPFVVLDAATGDLVLNRQIELYAGSVDRGQSLAVDGAGNAYIGGSANGQAFILRLSDIDTDPQLDWVQHLPMGVGANVNALDVTDDGDALLSLDRRGATTFFSAARLNARGELVWAKTWDDQNAGDNNNTYVIRAAGDAVLVGGRIAFQPFDTQFGEGFILALDPADGAYQWATFYYGGKGAEEMTEHRVKGLAMVGDELKIGVQSYTNALNFSHYWGFWYTATDAFEADPPGDGAVRLVDYALPMEDITAQSFIEDVPDGTAHVLDAAAWVEPPATVTLTPSREREGSGGDGDITIMSVTLAR